MVFPTTLATWPRRVDNQTDILASQWNMLGSTVQALETKVGITDSAASVSFDYKVNSLFREASCILYFYEDSPPTGWSTIGMPTDKILAVKGGSDAYNATGGYVKGTWTWPSHTLASNEMPAHTHKLNRTASQSGDAGADFYYVFSLTADIDYPTSSAGGDTGHSHGGDAFRPKAGVGIIAKFIGS